MKWLLFALLSINLILFMVNYKDSGIKQDVIKSYPDAKGIQLLSEVASYQKRQADRCLVLSGFESVEALQSLAAFLNVEGIKFDQVNIEEDLAPSYWVYSVPDGNKIKKAEFLKSQGVDSYVIPDGELKGMLSLGLFENIDLAKGFVKSLETKGIKANFHEKKKVKVLSSIQVKINDFKDKEALLARLQEMRANIGEIKEFFCKTIASQK